MMHSSVAGGPAAGRLWHAARAPHRAAAPLLLGLIAVVAAPADLALGDAAPCGNPLVSVMSPSGRHLCVSEATSWVLGLRGYALHYVPADPAVPGTPAPRDTTDHAPVMPSLDDADRHIPAGIASSNNRFAFDFYREVTRWNDRNVFFSPLSMYVALSALYEGADEGARAQLGQAFGFEPDDARRAESVLDMMGSINREDPHAILEMANGIAEFMPLNEQYLKVLKDVYLVDPIPPNVGEINGWGLEKTHGKIPKVIEEIPPDPAMVVLSDIEFAIPRVHIEMEDPEHDATLLNAIYFKGMWVSQFDPGETMEGDFEGSGGVITAAEFMSMPEASFDYAEADGVQLLRMPYEGGRLSMILLLPGDSKGIDGLGDIMSGDLLAEWTDGMRETYLAPVKVPKFEMKTRYDLTKQLQSMGVTDISARYGALYEMAGVGDLYLRDPIQYAHVMVNEEGTEAAAVTSVFVGANNESPPAFIADSPFLFIIQDDESGTILFMGRVSNPQA